MGMGGGVLRSAGALATATLLAGGCASIHPAPARDDAGGGMVISAERIRATQAKNGLDALELAGTFLSIHDNATGLHITMRGPTGIYVSNDALLVVDETPVSDAGYLASLPAQAISEIRILTAREATLRYGTSGGAGVIEVYTRAQADTRE